MNKTVVAMSLALIFSGQALAETEQEAENKSTLVRLENEASKAELLTATNAPAKEEGRLHGTLGTNIEVERVIRDDGVSEGKLKYTLAQGSFRHDDLPGWDFGFYSAREELFNGNLKHADYDRGVNSIQEIWANRSYGQDWGSVGWGVKLAGESIDKRTTPEAKVFGNYNITDRLDIHGYAMYHVEYNRGSSEFPYWEIEPGFGYKIADNMGAWLNFRYQEGTLKPKSGDNFVETETIIKPGIWYSWGDFSASFWGEFGKFEKENDRTGAHEWSEDYWKLGISANYALNSSWRVFGEVSYKDIQFEDNKNTEFDGYIPLFIAGINYSF